MRLCSGDLQGLYSFRTINAKSLPDISMQIDCSDKVASTRTDSLDRYLLAIAGSGRCQFEIDLFRQADLLAQSLPSRIAAKSGIFPIYPIEDPAHANGADPGIVIQHLENPVLSPKQATNRAREI
jgi:hypothetical protein